jgi:hypothetical protein
MYTAARCGRRSTSLHNVTTPAVALRLRGIDPLFTWNSRPRLSPAVAPQLFDCTGVAPKKFNFFDR